MQSTDIAMNANAFASTFYFFSTHNANAEKNKKSLQANAPDSADICAYSISHSYGRTEARTDNTGLAKVAVQYSADTFVVNQSLVLRINICGKNRHLRQARKRYASL